MPYQYAAYHCSLPGSGWLAELTHSISHTVGLQVRLGVGGVAGLVAGTATYPIHVLRRRMQVQSSADAGAMYMQGGTGAGGGGGGGGIVQVRVPPVPASTLS